MAGILTSSDNYSIKHSYKGEAKYDIEGGFNLGTGYTFSNAIFDKDIVVKLGYEYLKGQNDYSNKLDDVKTVLGTVSLGNFFNGFYTVLVLMKDYLTTTMALSVYSAKDMNLRNLKL